ncbi:hypothetical protein [Rothia dentocariosa]|uniref:hypothetical protein n=1 Tax=Rothia dentocariosa TaxID=2047 RepID=UPI0003150C95|nr:hypothetical protein [Rothia dentocariosa]QKI10042.1 hypothetical protein FOC60_09450 [Rothia dentocariosa]
MARRNTAASKKAAELAAGFAAKEEELQNLAVEFFDLEEKSKYGKIQNRIQEYQQKLEELQSLSKEAKAELFAQQAPIILAMKRVGESPANIAARLGVSVPVVRQALSEQKHQTPPTETTHDTETVPGENSSSVIPQVDNPGAFR